jgi:hypothetical protein
MSRDHTLVIDKELADQVVKLRDDEGKKWDEINEITGVATGKCMLAYSWAKVPKGERIKNATAADVVRLRDEQSLSWGEISARTSINENACRSMYEEATKRSTKGNRIGKGGRHPGSAEGAEPKAAKAPRAAKPAEPAHDLFADLSDEEVAERLSGYAIKVDTGSGVEPMKVKAVKKVAKGKAILVDAESGASRTIKLAQISQISKKKVA